MGRGHDAAGGAGEDRVVAPEGVGIRHAAGGLHDVQGGARQFGPERRHVVADEGREVGVHAGRVAARRQADGGGHLVGRGDPVEAGLPRDFGDERLVGGMAVGVQADDGQGRAPRLPRGGEGGPHGARVRRLQDRAIRREALAHLHHPLVQERRALDAYVEDLRPGLRADGEGVAESRRDRERRAGTVALQQGVRRHRRPHAHVARRDRVGCGQAQDLPDRDEGGAVGREDLRHLQAAVRTQGDAVREGAPPVDPERPAVRHARHGNGPRTLAGHWRRGLLQCAPCTACSSPSTSPPRSGSSWP